MLHFRLLFLFFHYNCTAEKCQCYKHFPNYNTVSNGVKPYMRSSLDHLKNPTYFENLV